MGRIYDATWGRLFSAVYDRAIAATEDAGLRDVRRELLSEARGRTVEIGAGTGANLALYPATASHLVLVEPDRHMRRRLEPRAQAAAPAVEVVDAPAESLPFEDSEFDTAVFTLALCTVPDPDAALAEAARVLKPGGRLLFLEHVRSENPRLARWQDRLEHLWCLFADGCHCNRDTVAAIDASGFSLERVDHGALPKAAPLVRPLVWGSAAPAS
ncbi:MAG TPA: class I SAM-dependent methyltransferase [Solirubrobacterales bacterium]|jgi:ubiquinone/menaquinone biosynthesis C-methylase UbiE|nr:class I SAM-dependent methyltransferase [Solirubrobacterales bacterium]